MAVTGPNPAESYGGIDFVSYEIPSYGTLYTAAGNAWHEVMEAIRAGDAPFLIPPDTAQLITVGILSDGPIGLGTILPPGTTFEWFLFYTHPNEMVWAGSLADSPWIGASGTAQAAGTQPGLILPPPWMSTLPWGTMFYSGPRTMQFTVGAAPGPYAAVMGRMQVNVQWFAKWTLPPVYEPPPPYVVPPDPVVVPVNPPTPPPTNIVNPTTVPTNVQLRQQIQKANPGFTCDITRHEYYRDLVQVFLGQKILTHVEAYGNKLGMVNRGNVVTQTRFRWKASGGSAPRKDFTSLFRLEAIPGNLLPGAGTSNSGQDAAGFGADIGMYHALDADGTGLDLGMLRT